MELKYFLCFVAVCFACNANATTKKASKKKPKADIRLVEAYTQQTLPGIPRGPVTNGTHIIIVWESEHYPETFFWRGNNGWLNCKIAKAHKVTRASHNVPDGMAYINEKISPDAIHKGDTLELNPVTGGRFPIPAEIPTDAKNTLYYKTGGSAWLAFPVKTIGKKRDIAAP